MSGLMHWQRGVIDNTLRMLAKATPEARIEALALLNGLQTPIDPGASPDLLPIDQGTVTPTVTVTAPVPAKKPVRSAVTLIRRVNGRIVGDEPETDDRGLTQGGTPPEEFWSRPDPDKAAMKRTKRLPMGRPLT